MGSDIPRRMRRRMIRKARRRASGRAVPTVGKRSLSDCFTIITHGGGRTAVLWFNDDTRSTKTIMEELHDK